MDEQDILFILNEEISYRIDLLSEQCENMKSQNKTRSSRACRDKLDELIDLKNWIKREFDLISNNMENIDYESEEGNGF